MLKLTRVSHWLDHSNPFVLTMWSIVAAFVTYFSMYALRKPYTVAQYEGLVFWGVGYKVILLFSQVGGYALSKFIGIRVISEMPASRRALSILVLVGIAHLALLPYAVVPLWLKPFFLFLNGLPLGMVYGCVFAFLEGRRMTEAMGAGLCASFIMASGNVKSVGAMLMEYQGVSQFWMPFLTGAIFWIPLLAGVWMLEQIPPPSDLDLSARSKRPPLTREDRSQFFQRHTLVVCVLVMIVILLTIFRTIRDDYAAEIWTGFGFNEPAVFAQSETVVAVLAIVFSALAVFVRNNYRAFQTAMLVTGAGFAVAIGLAVSGRRTEQWSETGAFWFMVLLGVSLYVPYVLFHTTIYERLLANLKEKSNVGFLMYLSDFAGYISSVVLLVAANLISKENIDFVALLFWIAAIISPISILGVGIVMFDVHRKHLNKVSAEGSVGATSDSLNSELLS